MPTNKASKAKGPLVFTAALLISLPVCMAEQATATYASSFVRPDSSQSRLQTSTAKLQQNLPRTNQGSRLLSSSIPSLADINTLESTLSSYKSQLATLKSKSPKDPKVQANLDSAISALEDDIATLEETIAQLRTTYTLLTKNNTTLGEAISSYNLAVEAKNKLSKELQDSGSTRQRALSAKLAKQDSLTLSTTAFDSAKSAKDVAESAVATAVTNAESAKTNLNNSQASKDAAQEAYDAAVINFNQKSAALEASTTSNESNIQKAAAALAAKNSAKQVLTATAQTLATAEANLTSAQETYTAAQLHTQDVITTYNQLIEEYNAVYNEYLQAESQYRAAEAAYNQAQDNLNQAQTNYDTNLIPDPAWTVPTQEVAYTRQIEHTRQVEVYTQVPHTTTQVVGGLKTEMFDRQGYNSAPPMPSANETPIYTTTVPNVDFNWGGGYILDTYYHEDVILKFSGKIAPTESGNYYFYTPADDGTRLYIDGNLVINDWVDKGGGGSTSTPIYLAAGSEHTVELFYYENGGGAAVSFYYYSPQVYPGWRVVPASMLGTQTQTTTTYTTEVSYVTETYYTEEIYYVTEPVTQVQKTINVDIHENDQGTYTAPAGATFVSSNLRYEAFVDPTCGANIYPNVQGLSQITLRALNSVWGDPCGGYGKHIVGTLTYLSAPTAPLINDPALLPALEQAQQEFDEAGVNFELASNNWVEAQAAQQTAAQATTDGYYEVIDKSTVQNNAYDAFQEATNIYNTALTDKNNAEATSNQAELNYAAALSNSSTSAEELEAAKLAKDNASADEKLATSNLETASTNLQTSTSELSDALTVLASMQSTLVTKEEELVQATSSKDLATTDLAQATIDSDSAEAIYQQTLANFTAAEAALVKASTFKQVSEENVSTTEAALTDKNKVATSASGKVSFTKAQELLNKEPEVEEGSKEIPAELTAENLLEVNLAEVDPTELTEAQAEQLVEAALETFETAEEGSPEYEQALDALYLAAEQDDIELPQELAAIPGLAGAVEVLNFLGNAGADMSPKVREESEKVVVATVVAAGAAIQSAAAAASAASAPSGGSRRVGK